MNTAPGRRINDGYLAVSESRILAWLCARVPSYIKPDHLTAVSLLGALIVFCSYAGARIHPGLLWLASFGLILNWCGDSLDGSLARFRQRSRERYGYFLDCMTDVFCSLLIMCGLGFSPFVHMEAALFALCGYLLLCIFVFLNHHVNGVHRLSFVKVGPTEMRFALILLNAVMFFGGALPLWGVKSLSVYDMGLIANGFLSIAVFIGLMMKSVASLSVEDPVPQALDRLPSTLSPAE